MRKKPTPIITVANHAPSMRGNTASRLFCQSVLEKGDQFSLQWLKAEFQTAISLINNAKQMRCRLIEIADPLSKEGEFEKLLQLADANQINIVVAHQDRFGNYAGHRIINFHNWFSNYVPSEAAQQIADSMSAKQKEMV